MLHSVVSPQSVQRIHEIRVRQIVCPVIPGTPKSVVGPLDILPGCSVGTLDLALAASVNVTAIVALSQIRDCVMFE